MARSTLPSSSRDLLSLVGAGREARAPQRETDATPHADTHNEDESSSERVARKSIQPKGKGTRHASTTSSREPTTAVAARKEKFNCRLRPDLADAIRDCVVALSGPPLGLTIDAFSDEAFRREIDRLRRLHRDGEPFGMRPYNPKRGRPVG